MTRIHWMLAGILALVTSAFAWGEGCPTQVPIRIPYYFELPQLIFADHYTAQVAAPVCHEKFTLEIDIHDLPSLAAQALRVWKLVMDLGIVPSDTISETAPEFEGLEAEHAHAVAEIIRTMH